MPSRRRRLIPWDTQLLPHAAAVYPVPDISVARSQPTFPARVPRSSRRNPDPGWVASGAYVPFAVHPESWAPRFPDRVPPPRRPAQQAFADPCFGFHTSVAAGLAWTAHFPPVVSSRGRPVEGGYVGPLVPIHEEPCVEWTIEVATITDLIDEAVASSGLIDEALTSTDLIAEEFC